VIRRWPPGPSEPALRSSGFWVCLRGFGAPDSAALLDARCRATAPRAARANTPRGLPPPLTVTSRNHQLHGHTPSSCHLTRLLRAESVPVQSTRLSSELWDASQHEEQLHTGPRSQHCYLPALMLADRAVFAAATSRRWAATNSAGHAFPGPGAMRAAASASLGMPLVLGVAPPTEALLGGPPLCCPSKPSPGISARSPRCGIIGIHCTCESWRLCSPKRSYRATRGCHTLQEIYWRKSGGLCVRMRGDTGNCSSSSRTDGELRLGLGPLAHAAPRGVLTRLTRVVTHHRQSVEPAAGHLHEALGSCTRACRTKSKLARLRHEWDCTLHRSHPG